MRTHLNRVYGTTIVGDEVINCGLQSIDGGKIWFVIDKERHVLGCVEDIYSGLIEHIEVADGLSEFAESRKQIDLSKESDCYLFTDCGVEIKKTK